MNKNDPSWMLPLLALLAVVLGVNRISTSPRPNDEPVEQNVTSAVSDTSTKKKLSSGKPDHETALQTALLFYEHDAFHILHNFFETENLAKDPKLQLEVSPRDAHGRLAIDVTSESETPNSDAAYLGLWHDLHEQLTRDKYQLDFMIVGVPDPEASHLSMETDWTLDMLQRGLESSSHRFVLDRFDLPWRLRVRDEQSQAEEEGRRPDEEPGLMLFRCGKISTEKHLLLVFLVGETPTAGVHKIALTRAIAQIAALTRLSQSYPETGDRTPWMTAVQVYKTEPPGHSWGALIPVLGPHFTGSLRSYELAFRTWSGVRFDCVTGSATSLDQDSESSRVSIRATQWPDAAKIRWLRDYLETQFDGRHDEVAVLRESNTGYGSAALKLEDNHKKDPTRTIQLAFPMHISRLRTYEDESQSHSSNSNPRPGGRPFLPLSAADKEEEDLLPPFSAAENASNWLVLDSILDTIGRSKIRFVIIRATNIQDVVFLAREVERNCPDTMIFVLTSDDLLLNPDAISAMRGTIVLTTYPLLAYNQEWTRVSIQQALDPVVHFPAQGAEGTYNAVLALLSDIYWERNRKDAFRDAFEENQRMTDYRNPFVHNGTCCPPLWMTVVGDDAMWPVRFISTMDVPASVLDYLYVPRHTVAATDNSRSVIGSPDDDYQGRVEATLELSKVAFAASIFIWALIAYFTLVLFKPKLWLMQDRTFYRTVVRQEVLTKNCYLIGFSMLLWLTSLMLTWVTFFPIAARHWAAISTLPWSSDVRAWAFFLLTFATTLVVSLYPISVFELDYYLSGPLVDVIEIFLPLLTLLLVIIRASAVLSGSGKDDAQKIIDYFRFANIGSGVSMFQPLFYLNIAAMFWVFSNIRRLMFSEKIAISEHQPSASTLGLFNRRFSGLECLEKSVDRTIRSPSHRYLFGYGNWQFALVVAGAALFGCAACGLVPIRWTSPWNATIEPGWFYTACFVLLLSTAVALACELSFIFDLWRKFRAFLDRASGEHFLKAFEGEKDEYSVRPKFSISAAYSDLTIVRLALEDLRKSKTMKSKLGEVDRSLRTLELGGSEAPPQVRMKLTSKLKDLTICAQHQSGWEKDSEIQRLLYYRVFDYSQRIAHGIRNLLVWIMAGLFFVLLAISSYPFPNNDSLLRLGWILVLTAVATSVAILIGMNRNRVLSIFSGGTPGKIDWNSGFVFHLLILGLLPILGVLGVQFPATFQGTSSWISSLFNFAPHP